MKIVDVLQIIYFWASPIFVAHTLVPLLLSISGVRNVNKKNWKQCAICLLFSAQHKTIFSFPYSCLQVINQMVSGGSFALLAEFLPGIKVLIQVASQLGVYVKRPE